MRMLSDNDSFLSQKSQPSIKCSASFDVEAKTRKTDRSSRGLKFNNSTIEDHINVNPRISSRDRTSCPSLALLHIIALSV